METDTKPRIMTAITATSTVNGRLTLNFSIYFIYLCKKPAVKMPSMQKNKRRRARYIISDELSFTQCNGCEKNVKFF